jgi:high affinity sulfate transporter 1
MTVTRSVGWRRVRRTVAGWPGARVIRTYQREWLTADLVAGVALTALLVPQGMAYAELAGLPAVTGLYTTVLALAAYAVFGPSRFLVLGPDSALAPLIAAAVVPLAAGDAMRAVSLGAMLALLTGAICLATGLARLGAITELLSKPVRVGYINGIAVVVLVSQLPKLLGFSVTADGFVADVRGVVAGVVGGQVSVVPAALGVGSLVVMLVARWIRPRIPGVLIATVLATALVATLDLAADGVPVVGPLPAGVPTPVLPRVGIGDLVTLSVAAVGVAVVALADTSALSTTFAAKLGDPVDPNREIMALGAANLAAGAFQGFPMSASSSRTAAAATIGAKTQLTGVVGAVGIVGLLVLANDLLANLPSATLAAIVVVASFALFDLDEMRWLWQVRRSEFVLSLVALLSVTVVGVIEGLGIAIVLSLGDFVRRAWRPHDAVLGRVEGRRGYHDIGRHPEAAQIPGLIIFRFDAPIFFANAGHFERELADVLRSAEGPVRWVVLAAEPVTDIDTTASELLGDILDEFDRRGIELVFAELKGPVKDRLRTYGLYDRIGDDHFYPTLGRATSSYVDATGVHWVDWTDR